MNQTINNIESLEAQVGKVPGPRDLKVITFLDDHAKRWISESPFMFMTVANGQEGVIDISAVGAEKGFVQINSPESISIMLNVIDHPEILKQGYAFGSLLLIPHLDETLRINGIISAVMQDRVTIAVKECYLHCAKALIRSNFWQVSPQDADIAIDQEIFVQQSAFMALASVDQDFHADVSPKGDPVGKLLQIHEDRICFADRPGNRRVDSFRNILEQPNIAMMCLMVGTNLVMTVHGRATMSTDPVLCDSFLVQDKLPHLVTALDVTSVCIAKSPALVRSHLWNNYAVPEDIHAAEIFKAHVRLNKTGGIAARLSRVVVSLPGLMEKGLEKDYKNNLY
ncbi:pyridoxamine 5'-phosphate oxidase family protein [Acinetobacter puyangensis]|uniref:pyridoxamine 5'-phosphate oxidase family protein n=1 Tax=Acinetobacter puyangensis TaxID=1096779 RepID=UPI003A4E2F12